MDEKDMLCQERVFFYFNEVCKIPHGSGNEKALSDYLLRWAQSLGLEARQDQVHNVFIRKPATPGYEAAPAVMLQAHIDMVCEKAEGIDHDFAKDPIAWQIDGDVLSTGGRTTLGADDGIGVALAMAALEDGQLEHPALEVLFTTCEEDDFSGAMGFDTQLMQAPYLINLDNTLEDTIVCGSCGGMQVDIEVPAAFEPVPRGWEAYRLSVSGLKGGHSGEDIHRGRGNANVLLNRLLMAVEQCGDFRLNRIKGGSFRLAIPREAEAVIWLDPVLLPPVRKALETLEAQFRGELAATADDVTVTLEPAQAEPVGAVPGKILSALALVPDGIYQTNEVLLGLVDTSDNMGEVYLDEQGLRIVIEIRSAKDSLREYLFQRMQRLAGLLGGSCRWSNAYPSWDFRPESRLCQVYSQVYQQRTGREANRMTVHAGLEVGCFFESKRDIDAISIGPDCWDFHSPAESMRISSVRNVYRYLCDTLALIRE